MSAVIAGFPSNPQNFAACRDGLKAAATRYGATRAQLDKALAHAFNLMRSGRSAAYAIAEGGRHLRNGQIVIAQQPNPPGAA